MEGLWECTYSEVLETTIVDPPSIYYRDTIWLNSNEVSYFLGEDASRAELEASIGFTVDWYTNHANGQTVTFGFGYENGDEIPPYFQYGFRGSAAGPDRIIANEACIWKAWENDVLITHKYVTQLVFEKYSSLNLGSSASHQQKSTLDVATGANDTSGPETPFNRPMSRGQVLRIPHTTKTNR